jgi:hypothetical protein
VPDFKQKFTEFASRMVSIAPRCANEESTKLFLILPFLNLLGYDDRNPHEVCPEHHADFSEKYRNKVDLAILKDDLPIIAIECKAVGAPLKDDRGQLRSYFNAAKTVKMGVLTDGLVYEFYADSDEPNLMDDTAFLVLDLKEVAKGKVEDSTVDGIRRLQKAAFDPENIGAEAKRKLVFQAVLNQIRVQADTPSEYLVRLLLQAANITNIRSKALAEFTQLTKEAFKEYVNQQILHRLDLPQKDGDKQAEQNAAPDNNGATEPAPVADPRIVTTDIERAVFRYVQQRLAFLVKDEALYKEIENIDYRDYQGKFIVFYKRERKGRLFDFIESGSGNHRFVFAGASGEIVTANFSDIDESLLAAFKARVADRTPDTQGVPEAGGR